MKDINEIPRILRWRQVAEITPWSRSYTYDLMNQGKFPRPIRLLSGGQAVGWLASDIYDYMTDLVNSAEGSDHE